MQNNKIKEFSCDALIKNVGLNTINFFKKVCLATLIFLSALNFNSNAQNPNLIWANRMGGTGYDAGTSVFVDGSGNVFTIGGYSGVVDFDPGPGIYNLNSVVDGATFISKLDASGNFVWAKGMGGGGNALFIDAIGNIHIVGLFSGTADFDPGPGIYNMTSATSFEIFVSKLDASGNFVWAKQMGGTGLNMAFSFTVDVFGNVYTAGDLVGTCDVDPGPAVYNLTSLGLTDFFITKLDASGNFIWAKQIGGPSNSESYSIVTDATGNLFSTGHFSGTVDFDPGPGTFNLIAPSGDPGDCFILKIDPLGNFIWAKQMGGATNVDIGFSIKLDASGNVYTTGYFAGTSDFDPGPSTYNLTSAGNLDAFVSKLDALGNFVWAKRMGGPNREWPYSIALDALGNVYTTGIFNGTADFDPGPGTYNIISAGGDDIFMSKLDASGNFIWAIPIGGTNTLDVGYSITVDAAQNVYATGLFSNTADFDPCTATFNLTSAGFDDIYVLKLGSSAASSPSVSISASATTICSGNPVTFTATPTNGGPTPTYQWQVNGSNVGTNAATYTTNTLANGDIVTVILTSNSPCATGGTTSSNAITMVVTSGGTASVNISSTGSTICTGTNVTFTATPTNGGSTPTYQWQVNGTNVGTNAATYTTNTLANGDVVKVIMTSNLSCATGSPATSNTITMAVSSGGAAAVNISSPSTTICSGTSLTFTAIPINGGSTPTYQWQVNGSNVGTNSPTYTTSTLSNGDIAKVIMTSNLSCATGSPATSNSITITVTQSLTPSVNIGASSSTICAGTNVTFTATPTNGGTTPAYQWQVNGINVGTNNPTYTSNVLNNGDLVTCILTSNYACVTATTATSNIIQMTVNAAVIPSVSIVTSANNICIGTLVTFTATPVNGGATPSYQWKSNGINVGANSPTYSTNNISNGDLISCVLTNLNSCSPITTANSNNIAMIVTTTVVPSITITSSANNICPDASVTFTAVPVNIGSTPSYQWQLNGTNVGGNNLTYVNNSFTNGDKINCIMNTVTSCSSTPLVYSDTITMIVKPKPVISFNPSNPTISVGSSVQLNATVTGNLTSYLWTPSTGLNNPTILNPIANPVTTTIYNLNVIATNSCSADKKLTVTVFKDIYIPNSFTPNGDNKNDIFRIPPGTSLNLQYFIIYDKYGIVIFKTSDINAGWDGTYKGSRSPNGAYTYLIKGSDSKGEIFLNGTVLVIR